MLIAAQVESLGINGVALAQGLDAIGFRGVPLLPGAGRFDHQLVIPTISEMGPYDPDARYGHIAFRVPVGAKAVHAFLRTETFTTNTPFIFEWSEDQAATVHLRWTFDGARLLASYESTLPLDFMILLNGAVQLAQGAAAQATGGTLQQGAMKVNLSFDRPADQFVAAFSDEHAEVVFRGAPWTGSAETHVTAHRFQLKPGAALCLSLTAGAAASVTSREVLEALDKAQQQLKSKWMDSQGTHADCADAIQRLVGFGMGYDARRQSKTIGVNRDWAGPNGPVPTFLWDNVFTSAMASLFSPELGKQNLMHLLGIMDDGIPTAPPQRNLIVPIVLSKMLRFLGDRAFAEKAFVSMMKLVRFFFADRGDGHPWRDGNDDGLIELGSCEKPGRVPMTTIIQNAFDETGYDDSPMYSAGFSFQRRGLLAPGVEYDFHRGTLNLTMVGQNCLYVASCRSMAVVAQWLDRQDDAKWLISEAERVAALIGERLYCPEKGIFLNRFFNGEFSPVKTPDIFSPLLAEVADDAVSARLKSILLDPAQFWGDNIVPTVSRDDPAFGDEPWRGEQWKGNYWRGNIWAPTNYIVYLSIRHAGWDDVEPEFVAKCRRLFMDDWRPHQFGMENYPPQGHATKTRMFFGNGGQDVHYVWGGLLAMISLEELFSVEDVCEGLRFGTTDSKNFGSWRGFQYHEKPSSIEVGDAGVHLVVPDELEFHSNVPMSVRKFVTTRQGASFQYTCSAPAKVTIRCGGRSVELQLSPAKGRAQEIKF